MEEDFGKQEMDFGNLEGGILVCGGSVLVNWRTIIWMTSLCVASLVGVLRRSRMTLGGRSSSWVLFPLIRDISNLSLLLQQSR